LFLAKPEDVDGEAPELPRPASRLNNDALENRPTAENSETDAG
jgi:hypothetical protein